MSSSSLVSFAFRRSSFQCRSCSRSARGGRSVDVQLQGNESVGHSTVVSLAKETGQLPLSVDPEVVDPSVHHGHFHSDSLQQMHRSSRSTRSNPQDASIDWLFARRRVSLQAICSLRNQALRNQAGRPPVFAHGRGQSSGGRTVKCFE